MGWLIAMSLFVVPFVLGAISPTPKVVLILGAIWAVIVLVINVPRELPLSGIGEGIAMTAKMAGFVAVAVIMVAVGFGLGRTTAWAWGLMEKLSNH
jgi:hypothetical protein